MGLKGRGLIGDLEICCCCCYLDCRLSTADFRLQTFDCRLSTADFRLQTFDCRLSLVMHFFCCCCCCCCYSHNNKKGSKVKKWKGWGLKGRGLIGGFRSWSLLLLSLLLLLLLLLLLSSFGLPC